MAHKMTHENSATAGAMSYAGRSRPCVLTLSALLLSIAGVFFANGVAAGGVARSSRDALAGTRRMVVYSVLLDQQLVDNEEDRARGLGNNPFGNYRGVGIATEKEHVGPLPGDEGLYSYGLYSTTALKKRLGSAIFVCNYNFAKNGFCDVSYQFTRGSVIGVGQFSSMETKELTLVITGGTGIYRGVKGTIEASTDNVEPTVGQIQIVSHQVPVLQLESQRLAFVIHSGSSNVSRSTSSHLQRLTVYSVATHEQFIDNSDDEARGWTANPFGLRDRRVQFAESEDKGGPYPGDAALFSFNLYTDASLKTIAGSATLTCYYYFGKNAFCDATYQLRSGTLIGGNAIAFSATHFAVAITGGTSKYLTVTGDAEASPSGKQAQRLDFAIE